jgi:hypothetical protein
LDYRKAGFKEKAKTIAWGYKTCWQLDKKPMIFWYAISAVLAVLPAVALRYNQRSLSIISGFLSGQSYTYADAVPAIIALGVLITVVDYRRG